MIDIVVPKNNEKAFVKVAEELGFNKLGFLYKKIKDLSALQKKTKIKLYNVTYTWDSKADLCISNDRDKARHFLEKTKVHGVFGLEKHKEKDFMHIRNSGLNQVLAKIAKDKKKVIVFDFNSVLTCSGLNRSRIIGRMMQNVVLCRKYKVEVAICSFAQSPYQMRNCKDLQAFGNVLGMDGSQVKGCMKVLEKKIK